MNPSIPVCICSIPVYPSIPACIGTKCVSINTNVCMMNTSAYMMNTSACIMNASVYMMNTSDQCKCVHDQYKCVYGQYNVRMINTSVFINTSDLNGPLSDRIQKTTSQQSGIITTPTPEIHRHSHHTHHTTPHRSGTADNALSCCHCWNLAHTCCPLFTEKRITITGFPHQ